MPLQRCVPGPSWQPQTLLISRCSADTGSSCTETNEGLDCGRLLPKRIVGERRVADKDRILSLYDEDIRVLVREQAPGDNKLIPRSLERLIKNYVPITSYTADRGFGSPENTIDLEQMNIVNAICPRSVRELAEKLEDEEFYRLQKRRVTAYLGKPLKSKGFKNRKLRIEWCILSHNLWKLAKTA